MIKILRYGEVPNSEIFARPDIKTNVEGPVAEIIADVRANGDAALYKYAELFDKAALDASICVVGNSDAIAPDDSWEVYKL